jgi:hypothetical protein
MVVAGSGAFRPLEARDGGQSEMDDAQSHSTSDCIRATDCPLQLPDRRIVGIVVPPPPEIFHVQDGRPAPDEEGVDLPDTEAARAEAIRASGEMLRDCRSDHWDGREGRRVVADQYGRNVFTLRISGTDT